MSYNLDVDIEEVIEGVDVLPSDSSQFEKCLFQGSGGKYEFPKEKSPRNAHCWEVVASV